MGSFKKAFKSFVNAPAKVVSSIAKGDISGAIGGAASAASFGTIGSGGGFIDTEKYMPSANTLEAQEKAAKQASRAASEQAKKKVAQLEEEDEKRRKSIFFTSGQELGEDIGATGNLKRRGSILGN